MKAPLSWLRELVPDLKSSAKKVSDLFTFSGTEVEGIEKVGDDQVLQCAVTSNRVDCLGIIGLARDLAAVSKKPLKLPSFDATATGVSTRDRLQLHVEASDFCPRYVALVIEGLKVGPSPEWLVRRLESMGQKPINSIVDVTNYVLLECNQPLHAFDLDRLHGGRIVVRRARAGEKITALNGKVYDLDASMGAICDADRPVAIAGVMGGMETSVTESTRRIVIESAWFDPASIRKTSRKLALQSDSSFRFERGIDPDGMARNAMRAARLILEIAGGSLCREAIDFNEVRRTPQPITLRRQRIRSVTGVNVPSKRVEEILRALECTATPAASKDVWTVVPPSFRADLVREIDLVEEVIRIVGLEKVKESSGLRVMTVRPHPEKSLAESLRDRFVGYGFLETVTPTFVCEGAEAGVSFLTTGDVLRARNPVRAGEGVIRRSLLPSLLRVRQHNQDQGNDGLRFFEIHAAASDVRGQPLPERVPLLGFLVDGDFRDGRGVVESTLEFLGLSVTIAPSRSPHLEETHQVEFHVDGERLGILGVVARSLVDEFKLKRPPVYGEIDLRKVLPRWAKVRTFQGLPRFPAVVRDFAFIVDEARTFAEIEETVRATGIAELESLSFFDEYRGQQIGAGKKSLALSVVFRSATGTLTTAEVDAMHAKIVSAAASRVGARLRG